MFNFDSIFHTKIDWTNINLTDNPPCKTCEHMIKSRQLYPGNTVDNPTECNRCIKRLNYVNNCLMKLAWYESKENKNEE